MSTDPIKALANQLNALKSTGPRTPVGKASANSLKHGILSRNLIIPGENAADFEALLAQLLGEEQPVGTLEAEFDKELYKAIRALREGQAHAVLEGVATVAEA